MGGYARLGQLTWNVTDDFSLAGIYIYSYQRPGRFGFNYNALIISGTSVANTLAGQSFTGDELLLGIKQFATITNGYAFQFSWRANSDFAVSGWFSTIYPRLMGRGDGNILTYALTFVLPDVGKEGNLLGFVVGAEPNLAQFTGGNPQPFRVDLPLHFEAFYRYQLNYNISITTGVIWLTAPNQNSNNCSVVIGAIRTSFQF